ncbi:MAG: HAD family hydrolase [Ktedonobacterales bacterium]
MVVFFDIGDTLVDESEFARFRHEAIFRSFIKRGIAITEEHYHAELNNLSMQARMSLFDQLRWLAERNGGDTLLAMAVFRDYIETVAPEAPHRFCPFPDARATLTRLRRAGYRLGIIANQPTWIRARMRAWGLLECFERQAVIISDEVAVSKPCPEIFRFALQQAGVAPGDAVMVGNDYTHDMLPARALGMHTSWVERDDPYAPGAPTVASPVAAEARVARLAGVPGALAALALAPE